MPVSMMTHLTKSDQLALGIDDGEIREQQQTLETRLGRRLILRQYDAIVNINLSKQYSLLGPLACH